MSLEVRLEKSLNKNDQTKIIKVLKKLGDLVNINDVIFEVEGGKGASTVNSKVKGTIASINVKEGQTVNSDNVLAQINGEQDSKATNTSTNKFNYFQNLIKPVKLNIEGDITIIGGGPGGYVAEIGRAHV